jgi:hypothetical protein
MPLQKKRTVISSASILSYYNNLFFKGSMELHVDEIIIIHLDIVKQHVRFIYSINLQVLSYFYFGAVYFSFSRIKAYIIFVVWYFILYHTVNRAEHFVRNVVHD